MPIRQDFNITQGLIKDHGPTPHCKGCERNLGIAGLGLPHARHSPECRATFTEILDRLASSSSKTIVSDLPAARRDDADGGGSSSKINGDGRAVVGGDSKGSDADCGLPD